MEKYSSIDPDMDNDVDTDSMYKHLRDDGLSEEHLVKGHRPIPDETLGEKMEKKMSDYEKGAGARAVEKFRKESEEESEYEPRVEKRMYERAKLKGTRE